MLRVQYLDRCSYMNSLNGQVVLAHPHTQDGGHLGDEEYTEQNPAIREELTDGDKMLLLLQTNKQMF